MRKNAFTLIELLAVIVILAIIALIAVPIVINIINDAKKESLQRSVDLYMDHVQKIVTKEQMTNSTYTPDRCEIQSNSNIKCYKGETVLKTAKGIEELEVEMQGNKPTEGLITFNNNKISYENIKLEGTYYHMDIEGHKEISKEKKTNEPEEDVILETEDYRGYYADVDGDGTVDGVIYADLAHSDYYDAQINLKKYIISKNKYNGNFGEKEVITINSGSSGNERFYVMALSDFTTGSMTGSNAGKYYWYNNAFGGMNTYTTDTSADFGKGYENTGNIIEIWNKNGTGNGSYSGATQNDYDIFKHIQTKYQEGWYIPSKEEWVEFADCFGMVFSCDTGSCILYEANNIYGLSNYYWSSSQSDKWGVWLMIFSGSDMVNNFSSNYYYVRLGSTF